MNNRLLIDNRRRVFHISLPLLTAILLFSASATAGIGDKLERGLGNQIAREIEAETGVVKDPVLSSWVAGIGRQLGIAQQKEDVSYTFKILDSEDVNAIAVPGGYVYVTKGLLRFAQSEDEIASVLGHEVGHIAAKHSMEQLKAQILGTLVLSAFKNKRYSSMVGGAKLAGMFAMLKFSRDNEREADILGVRGASSSGYDPHRMMDFFNRMKEKEKGKVSRVESYLMTHPPFSERIEVISKQPEMQETADSFALAADGLAQRKLYEQARSLYQKALLRSPGMPHATSALNALPPRASFKTGRVPVPLSPTEPLNKEKIMELQTQLAAREKRQAGLEKQLRSAISSLSFAGNLIPEYDYTSIRVFQLAVEDINLAAKMISNISNANASIKDSLDELPTLAEQLGKYGPEANSIRTGFGKTTEEVLSGITTNQADQDRIIKSAEHACRSIEFAARQLTSALLMPRAAEIGASGLVETQLQLAKKNITQELNNSRTAVLNLEGVRSKLIITRINLQTCAASEKTMQAYVERAATYLGADADIIAKSSKDFGTAIVDTYESSVKKSSSTGDNSSVSLDFDSANILLNLLSWDIDREQKAAESTRGIK